MEWDDLRHFAAFSEAGSLSGAARTLSVEHATVARRIAALEGRLALKLVDRRGRRLRLTPDGVKVAALASRMSETMRAVERVATGAQMDLKGEVTISAPPAYAARVLAPRLARLGHRHKELSLRLLGEARTASLERREADIAIRLTRPTMGDLSAARIDSIAFHLVGLTSYLDETQEMDWAFIGYAGELSASPQAEVTSSMIGTRHIAIHADHTELQLAMVESGAGVAMLPDFMVNGRVDLSRAYPNQAPLRREVWMVIHSDMRTSAPLRAVADALRANEPS